MERSRAHRRGGARVAGNAAGAQPALLASPPEGALQFPGLISVGRILAALAAVCALAAWRGTAARGLLLAVGRWAPGRRLAPGALAAFFGRGRAPDDKQKAERQRARQMKTS